jgi:flagellar export protein FliJ
MAKFDFKFEALLKLRKMKQDQCERELAERTGRFLQSRQHIDQLQGQISDFYGQVRENRLQGQIEVGGLIADRRYLNQLHQLQHHQLLVLAKAQQRVDQARLQLAETKKQTDIMAKLKERALEKHRKEQLKRETIELDDLANVKVAWQRQQAI